MIDIDENTFIIRVRKTGLVRAGLISSLILCLLFFTDIISGNELSFSIFYLLPITTSIFLRGKNLGYIFSVLSALAWVIADVVSGQSYSSLYVPIWNTLVRFGYFIFHTIIFSKLLELISKVRDDGFRDPLTKAFNWRYFEEFTNRIIKASARKRSKIAIAYFDIDNFKKLNDSFGHNIGDQALILVSELVRNEIRAEDLFARLGGDEFALVFQDVEVEPAFEMLTRIKTRLATEVSHKDWNISLSIGCIVFTTLTSTIGPMLKQVDDLMYSVKRNGKNDIKVINQYSNS